MHQFLIVNNWFNQSPSAQPICQKMHIYLFAVAYRPVIKKVLMWISNSYHFKKMSCSSIKYYIQHWFTIGSLQKHFLLKDSQLHYNKPAYTYSELHCNLNLQYINIFCIFYLFVYNAVAFETKMGVNSSVSALASW